MPEFTPTETPEEAAKVLESVTMKAMRPRCCDWCDKRGFKSNPLIPFAVRTKGMYFGNGADTFTWWVHTECADMLKEDEDVAAWKNL